MGYIVGKKNTCALKETGHAEVTPSGHHLEQQQQQPGRTTA